MSESQGYREIVRLVAIALAASMALSYMLASTIMGGWYIGQKMDDLLESLTGVEIPDNTSLFGMIIVPLAIYVSTFRQSIQDPVRMPKEVVEAKQT